MPRHPPHRDLVCIGLGLALCLLLPAALQPTVDERHGELVQSLALGVLPGLDDVAPVAAVVLSVCGGIAATTVGFASLAGLATSHPARRTLLLAICGGGFAFGLPITLYVLAPRAGGAWFDAASHDAPEDFASLFRFSVFRLAAAIFAAAIAVNQAMKVPPYDGQRAAVTGLLGGLFGWIAAYPLLAFGLIRLLYPHLADWWSRRGAGGPRSPLPALPLASPGPTPRIEELRRKVVWIRQQSLPPHVMQTEIARLENEIRQLGGTP